MYASVNYPSLVQTMVCRMANPFWINSGILLIGPLGTNLSEMLIAIYTFSLKNAFDNRVCKMVVILSRSQCVKHCTCYTIRMAPSSSCIHLPDVGLLDVYSLLFAESWCPPFYLAQSNPKMKGMWVVWVSVCCMIADNGSGKIKVIESQKEPISSYSIWQLSICLWIHFHIKT